MAHEKRESGRVPRFTRARLNRLAIEAGSHPRTPGAFLQSCERREILRTEHSLAQCTTSSPTGRETASAWLLRRQTVRLSSLPVPSRQTNGHMNKRHGNAKHEKCDIHS